MKANSRTCSPGAYARWDKSCMLREPAGYSRTRCLTYANSRTCSPGAYARWDKSCMLREPAGYSNLVANSLPDLWLIMQRPGTITCWVMWILREEAFAHLLLTTYLLLMCRRGSVCSLATYYSLTTHFLLTYYLLTTYLLASLYYLLLTYYSCAALYLEQALTVVCGVLSTLITSLRSECSASLCLPPHSLRICVICFSSLGS
jgi:hypothetical protein